MYNTLDDKIFRIIFIIVLLSLAYAAYQNTEGTELAVTFLVGGISFLMIIIEYGLRSIDQLSEAEPDAKNKADKAKSATLEAFDIASTMAKMSYCFLGWIAVYFKSEPLMYFSLFLLLASDLFKMSLKARLLNLFFSLSIFFVGYYAFTIAENKLERALVFCLLFSSFGQVAVCYRTALERWGYKV